MMSQNLPEAIVMVFVFLVFYIVVIRSDRVERSQRLRAVLACRPGDMVLVHGVLGRVIETGSRTVPFKVEIAAGVVLTVRQDGITEVIGRAAMAA